MSKKTNLADALNQASSTPDSNVKPIKATTTKKPSRSKPQAVPPSRADKKAITGFFDPAVSRQLKRLALDKDTTIQALLSESLNDLFSKYGEKPIA